MDDNRALELYKVFREYASVGLANYHNALSHYLTLIAAILAGSLVLGSAALDALDKHPQRAFLVLLVLGIVGPGLIAWLCCLAVKLADRSYGIFLESVTILAKLKPLIGLAGPRPGKAGEGVPFPFAEERHLVPDRWLDPCKYTTSKAFVQELKAQGSNRTVRCTFRVLAGVHLLLGVGIAAISIRGLCGKI
jgi:hypothetical protein